MGHTRPPPTYCSNRDAFSFPITKLNKNIITPDHTGHTGNRANRSTRIVRGGYTEFVVDEDDRVPVEGIIIGGSVATEVRSLAVVLEEDSLTGTVEDAGGGDTFHGVVSIQDTSSSSSIKSPCSLRILAAITSKGLLLLLLLTLLGIVLICLTVLTGIRIFVVGLIIHA
jgi:hypothetical protein